MKAENKENILKSVREKGHCICKGKTIQMTDYFLSETTEDKKNGHTRKELSLSILYPTKISFRNEREIKTLSNEKKLRESVIKRSPLKN